MIGIQTVKIIKSDSSVYCMLGCSSGPECHWQRNWRLVSTSSRMCGCKRWTLWETFVTDNNNIHSAIWMKLSFLTNMIRVLTLFCNFTTNLNLNLRFDEATAMNSGTFLCGHGVFACLEKHDIFRGSFYIISTQLIQMKWIIMPSKQIWMNCYIWYNNITVKHYGVQ